VNRFAKFWNDTAFTSKMTPLVSVTVTTGPTFTVRATKRLFQHSTLCHLASFARYDVSPDGQRFLLDH